MRLLSSAAFIAFAALPTAMASSSEAAAVPLDGRGAIADVVALRAVADRWTYINSTVDVVNTAASESVRAGHKLILQRVPPLLMAAVRMSSYIRARLSAVRVTTKTGRLVKQLDLGTIVRQTVIAQDFLAALRGDPAHPFGAAARFGDRIDAERKRLLRQVVQIIQRVPRDERAAVMKAAAP